MEVCRGELILQHQTYFSKGLTIMILASTPFRPFSSDMLVNYTQHWLQTILLLFYIYIHILDNIQLAHFIVCSLWSYRTIPICGIVSSILVWLFFHFLLICLTLLHLRQYTIAQVLKNGSFAILGLFFVR